MNYWRKFVYTLISAFVCCSMQAVDVNLAVNDLQCIKNIPWGNVYMFFFDSDGYMWYGTENGICRDNGYQQDVFCSNEQNPRLLRSNYVFDIIEDGKGHIWFGTTQGTYILNKHDYTIHALKQKETELLSTESLCALSDGTVWMSTGSALYHFDADEHLLQKIVVSKRGTGTKFVNSMMEDSQHTLWLAQNEGCIWCYDINKKDFVAYEWPAELNPQCIIEDTVHGCYWVGTWGMGVVRFSPNKVGSNASYELQPLTFKSDGVNYGKVMDMKADMQNGMLWVSTTEGFCAYQFDAASNLYPSSITSSLPKGHYFYRNITRDSFSNLWVSGASKHAFMLPCNEKGIHKFLGPRKIADNTTDSLLVSLQQQIPDVIRAVCDRDGNIIYQGRKKGLQLLRKGQKQTTSLLQDYETCSCLTMLRDGTAWIGTSMGRVYAYDCHNDKSPRYVQPLSNTHGKRILDLKQDGKGHMWSLTRESAKEWDAETDQSRTLLCNHPMIHMDHFNELSLAGNDSVCISEENSYCFISSASFKDDSEENVNARISTIIVDGRTYYIAPDSRELDIDSKTDGVELRLTTMQYHLASQIQFAYRLTRKSMMNEHTTEWTEMPVGANTVVITSPRKGDYIVEVRSTNGQGVWGEPTEIFTIHRLPAWWETWWAYVLYVLVLLTLGISIIRQYLRHVRRKRMTQMEEQLTELKFRFFTNVSHELRTPLTLILVPVEQMLESGQSLSASDRSRLETIQRNALELQQLINQLLDFRRMETGLHRLSLRNADMTKFVSVAVESFTPLAQQKNIELTFDHQPQPLYATFDHEKMRHVVWNLLSNALKYTPEGGHVCVALGLLPDDTTRMFLHVKDDGIGINAKDLPRVFECYYRSENSTSQGGSGIGLHMVRELVRQHHGEVGVNSQEGKGTDFWFVMPLVYDDRLAENATDGDYSVGDDKINDDKRAEDNEPTDQSAFTILLVEDNAELRSLIAEQLHDEGYAILEAGDGKEAWQQLMDNDSISLVISDVMMPLMDGLELCHRIKTTERISHIPVLLLTARTSDEAQLEGYKMGADCYLTKPFSPTVLLNRIQHLQERRDTAKQSFQHDGNHEVAQLAYSPIDEEIITRAQKLVEEHLSDKAYNVNQFSSDMCASRMTLYRKIHSITGQSPSEFITTIRLKHAARLLRTSTLSTSQIAECTGFSTPSYFTKNFKEMFGVLPKDYRTQI